MYFQHSISREQPSIPNTHPRRFTDVININSDANVNIDPANASGPSWISNMLQVFEKRWVTIEGHLQTQNKHWQDIQLQLERQNKRMSSIEQEMSQIKELKANVSRSQARIGTLEAGVSDLRSKIHDYEYSIDSYSEICDDIVRSSMENDSKIDDVMKRLADLELNQVNICSKTR